MINAENYGINNRWYDESIGNYWSDYLGQDLNNDGIGDIPYTNIYGSGIDLYPIWNDLSYESQFFYLLFINNVENNKISSYSVAIILLITVITMISSLFCYWKKIIKKRDRYSFTDQSRF